MCMITLAVEDVPTASFSGSKWNALTEQVSRYVEREILNHRRLIHPHIVEMREVCASLFLQRATDIGHCSALILHGDTVHEVASRSAPVFLHHWLLGLVSLK